MEGFSRLVLELYCAARETPIAEFQETALVLLKPALRFDSAIWGTGSVSECGMQVHTVHVHEPSPELITRSQQINYQDRIAAEVMKHPGRAISFYSPALRTACSSAVRNFAAPRTHLVVASRDSASKLVSWLALLRESGDRQYGHSERRELSLIWPHLTEALLINRVLEAWRLDAGTLRHSWGICDRRGVLYNAEAGFITLLKTEWPNWRGPVLPLQVVSALSANNESKFRGAALSLRMTMEEDLVFLQARRTRASDRLTARERAVAQHFTDGHNHKEVARLLKLSPATVRSYIQVIYGKLKIADKAQLAAELVEAG